MLKEIGTPKKINLKNDKDSSTDLNRNFNNIWLLIKKVWEKADNSGYNIYEKPNGDLAIFINGKERIIKSE